MFVFDTARAGRRIDHLRTGFDLEYGPRLGFVMDQPPDGFRGFGVYPKRGVKGRCPNPTSPNVGNSVGHGFGWLVDVSQLAYGLERIRRFGTIGLGWENPGFGPSSGLERSIQLVDRAGRGRFFDVVLFWDGSKSGPTLLGGTILGSKPSRFNVERVLQASHAIDDSRLGSFDVCFLCI